MIDVLIGGTLHGAPEQKTGQAGKPFVVCKVRTPMQSGEALVVNVICFDKAACAALLGLHAGEPVHLAGSLTPKVWTPPQGEPRPVLDLVCSAVLTVHHIAKHRKAVQEMPAKAPNRAAEPFSPAGAGTGFDDLESDLL